MPKQRITKEMVVNAAFEIARSEGIDKALVASVAEKLGCSVQPIYSYCKDVDTLRGLVSEKAREFVLEYVRRSVDKDDMFRSTGHAYVKIAKEEPHIFRMYLSQERKGVASLGELYQKEAGCDVASYIASSLGIPLKTARQLHLNMLIYTIGVGTIISVTPSIGEEEIFAQHELAYEAFLRYAKGGSRGQ